MSEDRHVIETKAAQLASRELEWNELDFVGWKEFRRMAPAVVALEVSRLDRLISALEPGCAEYNALVRTRYELRRFADGLAAASRESLADRREHLNRALLAATLISENVQTNAIQPEAVQYVIHRLRYIHQRLDLIYEPSPLPDVREDFCARRQLGALGGGDRSCR